MRRKQQRQGSFKPDKVALIEDEKEVAYEANQPKKVVNTSKCLIKAA